LASKFEAIKGRGATDIRLSHDFEDVVYIFDNCNAIEGEFQKSNASLKKYVKEYTSVLVKDVSFSEAVSCALPLGFEDRAEEIIERIKNLA
jgi:hypothetical protein